ncbi:diacylglycerol kinase family protein [Brevibacillus humidisoli]|uniref:diacylglycerol kinase n=1 Tax=Brevibacillus humidisoli TaxID=2895522 RepID=UPI001E316286|nr:diacylglycerol kinase family protein [Brevibacillus humidisoli]UFJ43148.1 diacylglycerol kinase family protein [Brevibacillus humidisoli]
MRRARRFWRSFGYACAGLLHTVKTQRNMQIHVAAALLTLLGAWWLDISRTDLLLVFFAIGLVMALELVNTSIEAAVDLVTEEWHAKAKIAKDAAAGAVLLAALTAAVIGLWVYGPPLVARLSSLF